MKQTTRLSDILAFIIRDRLAIAALALFLVGFIFLVLPIAAPVNGIGGILFGTGLSVGLSTWSSRQQAAKDANLRRKKEVYTPLYAELQNFHELLNQVRRGAKPCPQWINVSGQTTSIPQLLNNEELSVQLIQWSKFRNDSRILDFTEPVRRSLDHLVLLAQEYDHAVERVLKTSESVFASFIKAAASHISQSEDYQQWSIDHANVTISSYSSSSPNDWYVRIRDALSTGSDQMPAEESWAAWWLETAPMGYYRPTTLGWLIAKNPDEALQAIYKVLTPQGSYPPPPTEWLRAIVDEAWSTLQKSSDFHEVQRLLSELFNQVSQIDARLLDKLRYIQEVYEGGPPPV